MTHRRLLALLPLFVAPTLGAGAQVTNVRSGGSGTGSSVAAPGTAAVREAQTEFERFRRNNLPPARSVRGTGGNGSCDEQVGNFCEHAREVFVRERRSDRRMGARFRHH